jgi:hypothetical protein
MEGPNASRHLVENDTQREEVGTAVLQMAENLFRGEIGRSSEQISAAGGLRGKAGNAEIAELHLMFGSYENIGGLHVAMNDIGAMGLAECGGEISRPHGDSRKRQRAGVERGFQRFALNVFHDEIRRAVLVGANIEKGHDVGMREATDNLGFTEELLLEIAGAKTLKKGFYSDGAPDESVAGFIDTAGGARAEHLEDFVTVLWSAHKLRVILRRVPVLQGVEWERLRGSGTPQKAQFRKTLVLGRHVL